MVACWTGSILTLRVALMVLMVSKPSPYISLPLPGHHPRSPARCVC